MGIPAIKKPTEELSPADAHLAGTAEGANLTLNKFREIAKELGARQINNISLGQFEEIIATIDRATVHTPSDQVTTRVLELIFK